MKYNKYVVQKYQVSHDDGETWEDVSPSYTRLGRYVGTYSSLEDCISGGTTIDDIVVTDEMWNSLYTIIYWDGSTYIATKENLPQVVKYYGFGNSGVFKNYDYNEDGKLILNDIAPILSDNPNEPTYVLDIESRYLEFRHGLENARAIVIGNDVSIYRNWNEIDGWSGAFPSCIRVTDLFIGKKLEIITNILHSDSYLFLPNLIRVTNNSEMPMIFDLPTRYVKELTFNNDLYSVDDEFYSGVEKITIYGNMSDKYYDGQHPEFLLDFSEYKKLDSILCYASKNLETHVITLITLAIGTRLYVPDNFIDSYQRYTENGVIPMSMYGYDVLSLTTSAKAKAVNVYGEAFEIPNSGSTMLTQNEVEKYLSAYTESHIPYGHDGRYNIAYIKIGDSVRSIGSGAFNNFGKIVTLSIPSGVTSIGENAFNSDIQNIIFNGSTPPYIDRFSTGWVKHIYVPDEAYETYVDYFLEFHFELFEKLKPLSEYYKEFTKENDYPVTPCSLSYRWITTTSTTCVGYDKYYLYKKQQKCKYMSGDWTDVVPEVTSYNGDGTMTPRIAENCSEDCGCSSKGLVATLTDGSTCSSPCSVEGYVNHCSNISDVVTLEFKECVTYIQAGFADNAPNLVTITMTDNVTSIGQGAFSGNTELRSARLSNNIISLSRYLFNGCTNLNSINIPTVCTSIGDGAFSGCTNLSIVSGATVLSTIGAHAFDGCETLTHLQFADTLTSIGAGAFANCTSLVSIKLNSTTPPSLGANAFDNTNNCPIYVPYSTVTAYKAASGWSAYADRIVGY